MNANAKTKSPHVPGWAIHDGASRQNNGLKRYDGARKSMNRANSPVFL